MNRILFIYCTQFIILCALIVMNITPTTTSGSGLCEVDTKWTKLYYKNDHVVVFNESDLYTNIYGSNKSWLIMYYQEYSGISHQYRDIFKNIANSMMMEKGISFGVFNCICNRTQLCHIQDVHEFPTARYYSPNLTSDSLGMDIELGPNTEMAVISRMRANERNFNKFVSHSIVNKSTTHEPPTNYKNITVNEVSEVIEEKTEGCMRGMIECEVLATSTIYVLISFLLLIFVLWCKYYFIDRKQKNNINVYTVLHKSQGNNENCTINGLKNEL